VNLGGGPRPTPKTEKGVPVYLHDWFGPGRHALVASTKSKEFRAEESAYRAEPQLTGNESRVKEVSGVEFPKLLDPVDDLPPATIITHVRRLDGGKVSVRGSTTDNGMVKKVLVNGKAAQSVSANFAEWEVVVEEGMKLTAHAEDAAGNVEMLPHEVKVSPKR
jgi:hypothetical protein